MDEYHLLGGNIFGTTRKSLSKRLVQNTSNSFTIEWLLNWTYSNHAIDWVNYQFWMEKEAAVAPLLCKRMEKIPLCTKIGRPLLSKSIQFKIFFSSFLHLFQPSNANPEVTLQNIFKHESHYTSSAKKLTARGHLENHCIETLHMIFKLREIFMLEILFWIKFNLMKVNGEKSIWISVNKTIF